MSKLEIERYKYAWKFDSKIGFVKYHYKNGVESKWIRYRDADEFQIIIHTLATESPVYMVKNTDGQYLQTDVEEVGELEN